MYRIEFSFGHRHHTGEPVPRNLIVRAEQRTLNAFTKLYGGGQVYHRLGGYCDDGHPMQEASSVVWSYGETVDMAQLWSLAAEIAQSLNQESVLLAVVPMQGVVQWIGPHNLQELAGTRSLGGDYQAVARVTS